jgi:hypothetical protein
MFLISLKETSGNQAHLKMAPFERMESLAFA